MFILTFIIVITASIPGIFLLVGNVEASLEQVLPPTVESVDAMNDARTQYSADMLHVVVYAEGPLTDITYADNYIQEFSQRISAIPEVTTVQTSNTSWHVNADKTLAVIDIQADTGANTDRITETITEIEDAIYASQASNPGARTQITGFAAIDKATFSTIMSDFVRITAVAIILIIFVVWIALRNFTHVAIAMSTVFSALLMTM
jgi:predicted RND superfamily exporter protein